jgi:predicted dehydrogenase
LEVLMMKELRVALIGGGFMGRAHSLALALAPIADDLGATIRKEVVVELTPELATGAATSLGWAASSADWKEVVSRPDIDIVDICTPPPLHAPIALAAIANGKHVFCEKPISNDAAEGLLMAQKALEANVVTQVGFNYRHTPAISFAKQLLDAGRLGTPLEFRARYLQEAAFWGSPNRWRARKATGGSGMVADIGSHIIEVSEYMLGDIRRVVSLVRSKAPSLDLGWLPESRRLSEDLVDDGGVWLAEFANGVLGSFSMNAFASGRKNLFAFELDASKGAVEFDWNRREEFRVSYVEEPDDHRGFRTIHTDKHQPDGWWHLAGLGTGYVEISAIQFQHFIKAIMSGTRARPDFADAAHVQQVVEAVRASAVSQGWVDVPDRMAVK